MLPKILIKNYDQHRLRNLLVALFVALAIPTAVLIWQAYGQLKWESYYQYRVQAEELTIRIDSEIANGIRIAESRSYGDFAFLNSVPEAKIQQRSPLAAWPVNEDLPGVIGYFQVDADGHFSTPILPPPELAPGDVGLDDTELGERRALAGQIQTILAENQLVRDRGSVGGRLEIEAAPRAIALQLPESAAANAPAPGKDSANSEEAVPESTLVDFDSPTPTLGQTEELPAESEPAFSQMAFDKLNQADRQQVASPADLEFDDTLDAPDAGSRTNAYGKVQDLKLDEELQKKSEGLKRQLADSEEKVKEAYKIATTSNEAVQARRPRARESSVDEVRQDASSGGMTIKTFESEIDPFEFSLLDSGHLVLFRNVWRDGNRTIQGLLVEQDRFINSIVEMAFRSSALSDISSLVIGYNDDVIRLLPGGSYPGVTMARASELDGALLYRAALSAPFDRLELIYTASQLPPGPGATVLAWTTLIIGIVFLGGFFALYRLGLTQIRLAQQQQDFVSAVSHELKTPLTSIRMYGEMLKEGWADEAKQKQYYEYIHDESERLTRLISNVLQLAKISRNEPQFNMKPISVNALIDQVQSKIANQVERAGYQFNVTLKDITPEAQVSIDEDCFAQIIINLVDNAIKFSKESENKTIELGCRLSSEQRVEFTVRDFGPGIPGNQMKKIFRLFYRTESELTRETVGTGIGLAIVHQLTTAMDGKIDVVNRDPGAEFNVSFHSL